MLDKNKAILDSVLNNQNRTADFISLKYLGVLRIGKDEELVPLHDTNGGYYGLHPLFLTSEGVRLSKTTIGAVIDAYCESIDKSIDRYNQHIEKRAGRIVQVIKLQ